MCQKRSRMPYWIIYLHKGPEKSFFLSEIKRLLEHFKCSVIIEQTSEHLVDLANFDTFLCSCYFKRKGVCSYSGNINSNQPNTTLITRAWGQGWDRHTNHLLFTVFFHPPFHLNFSSSWIHLPSAQTMTILHLQQLGFVWGQSCNFEISLGNHILTLQCEWRR